MGEGIHTQGVRAGSRMAASPTQGARINAAAIQEQNARKLADERKHGINKGLNAKELETIEKIEKSIAFNKKESAYVVDSDGNVTFKNENGKARSVSIPNGVEKDKILTHNHPQGGFYFKDGIAAKVGASFSSDDIGQGINNDAKEIRAKTYGYTFSIRRPEGGWKISGTSLYNEANRMYKQMSKDVKKDYIRKGKTLAEQKLRNDRANATTWNRIWTELAKKYGFEYTRRKS